MLLPCTVKIFTPSNSATKLPPSLAIFSCTVARFEVLTMVLMKIQVFWDVKLCQLVDIPVFCRSVVSPSAEF